MKAYRFAGGTWALATVVAIIMLQGWIAAQSVSFEWIRPTLAQPWNFIEPQGITRGGDGNLYIADTGNHRIQVFATDGAFVRKWGEEGNLPGQFGFPACTALDDVGNVYVVDTINHRVQKFTAQGEYLTYWGGYGTTADGKFNRPQGIMVDGSGNVFVADTGNGRIQKFNGTGSFLAKWGSKGSNDGEFNLPTSLAFDTEGNIYVADSGNHRIQKFSGTGAFLLKWDGSAQTMDGNLPIPSQCWLMHKMKLLSWIRTTTAFSVLTRQVSSWANGAFRVRKKASYGIHGEWRWITAVTPMLRTLGMIGYRSLIARVIFWLPGPITATKTADLDTPWGQHWMPAETFTFWIRPTIVFRSSTAGDRSWPSEVRKAAMTANSTSHPALL